MKTNPYNRPLLFYILSTLIPWTFWLIAAYLSHQNESYQSMSSLVALLGLLAPIIVSLYFILPNEALKKDFMNRFFNFRSFNFNYLYITFFLMLASILLAQLISLAFGYSSDQFSFASEYSFTSGIFPVWFLLIIAPTLEEFAWHTYGTDCLRSRFSVFKLSMIFALYWGIWHIPLSLIKDYYQSNLVLSGAVYSINFLVSLFPFVLIMNWLYYKTNRNIFIPIIFHITAGFFNEIFATHPMSKVIQTGLLVLLTIYFVIKDRSFFFDKTKNFDSLEKRA